MRSIMEMREYGEYIKKAMEILPKGAFLTAKGKDGRVNTMTIGWGSFGFEWGMPVFEAMVRESRFTKGLIVESGEFTVTFPYEEAQLKEALAYCGKVSGRDADKIAECSLKLLEAKNVDAPVVGGKGIVLECKVVMSADMDEKNTDAEVINKWYSSGDYHTMYYGKILACYEI